VELAKELHDELSPLYIKHAIEVHAMQLSDGMEPVVVVSNFPRKLGLHGGASVGSSLTTRNSYSTHCASVIFDDVNVEFATAMDTQPPTPRLTTTAAVTTMSPLTTLLSSYKSAMTRNLQQQPNNETTQLKQQMEELKLMMTNLMQRISEIESAKKSQDHEHRHHPAAKPSQDPQRE
jgi:uncharacterized protein YukE